MSRPIDRPALVDRVQVTPGERRALVRLGALALFAHGLFHGMGVALLWAWSKPGQLSYTDVKPVPGSRLGVFIGIAWLIAGLIFIAAAVLVWRRQRAWRVVAFVGVLVSVPMLLPVTLAVAIPGLVVDAAVLFAVAATYRPPQDAEPDDSNSEA